MPETKKCCDPKPKKGADHSKELLRVNRIKGQINGIAKMIDDKAYCPEIVTQIQAARSALASLQAGILTRHLEHCVKKNLSGSDKNELFQELIGIFKGVGS